MSSVFFNCKKNPFSCCKLPRFLGTWCCSVQRTDNHHAQNCKLEMEDAQEKKKRTALPLHLFGLRKYQEKNTKRKERRKEGRNANAKKDEQEEREIEKERERKYAHTSTFKLC